MINSSVSRTLLSKHVYPSVVQMAGIKYFPPPPDYSGIELPEKPKLHIMPKIPTLPPNLKPPKMIKNLKFMRGPEPIHNALIHRQYGIIALQGGRLRHGHFEMIRLTLGRKIDPSRMFLIWRVDSPWQPITKKSQGQRMGGGKGAIDHYVTPVKPNRVIVELGGKCEYDEVKDMLTGVANQLPFKAMAVSQKLLDERAEKEAREKRENMNPYTFEYLIKNNMGNCQQWIRRIDFLHFGKYD